MTWDKYGTPCHIQVITILLVSIGTMLSDVPRSRDLWLNAHLMAISWAQIQMLISRWPNPIPAWRADETPENSSNHWKITDFIPHPKISQAHPNLTSTPRPICNQTLGSDFGARREAPAPFCSGQVVGSKATIGTGGHGGTISIIIWPIDWVTKMSIICVYIYIYVIYICYIYICYIYVIYICYIYICYIYIYVIYMLYIYICVIYIYVIYMLYIYMLYIYIC